MAYYLAHGGTDNQFLGWPFPAAGARVAFDVERLVTEQAQRIGVPVDRATIGAEGLVVYEDPTVVLRIPDRLWLVDALEAPVRQYPSNRWLRCRSLWVVEELPTWLVLGPRGDLVLRVIDQARELTSERVRAVAALEAVDERRLVEAVWARWRPGRGSGSPVGCGLSELHDAVTEAARRTDPDLFGWDDEEGVEFLEDAAWCQAGAAAGAAALALGATEVQDTDERRTLAARWASVMGMGHPTSETARHADILREQLDGTTGR